MDKAVVRIQEAIENEELMVIYGDYDVDGISATAILYECLTSQGAHVRCRPAYRGSGYGLTRAALESLASKGFKLVVTVDNGISAVEVPPAQRSWALTSSSRITTCRATRCQTPSPLSTPSAPTTKARSRTCAARAWRSSSVPRSQGCDPAELLEMYGELAALGTVADVMPLVGENRAIVREGLSLLQDTMRPGCTRFWRAPAAAASPSRRTRSATVWPRA